MGYSVPMHMYIYYMHFAVYLSMPVFEILSDEVKIIAIAIVIRLFLVAQFLYK